MTDTATLVRAASRWCPRTLPPLTALAGMLSTGAGPTAVGAAPEPLDAGFRALYHDRRLALPGPVAATLPLRGVTVGTAADELPVRQVQPSWMLNATTGQVSTASRTSIRRVSGTGSTATRTTVLLPRSKMSSAIASQNPLPRHLVIST